mgnify:CR=1 FL=1
MLYIIKNDKMYMEQIKVDLAINKNIYVVDNIPFIYLFKKKSFDFGCYVFLCWDNNRNSPKL